MSFAYDIYIDLHKKYVMYAANWIYKNIDHDILKRYVSPTAIECISNPGCFADHDQSKFMIEEYEAYDNYFYNGGYSTEEGKKEFDKAFLHHLHHNPHHWQHWVLPQYDDSKETKVIDMPDIYILEMICDWWSFSWKNFFEKGPGKDFENEIYGIFDWYDDHKNIIMFSETTKEKVEGLLAVIKDAIPFADKSDYMEKK